MRRESTDTRALTIGSAVAVRSQTGRRDAGAGDHRRRRRTRGRRQQAGARPVAGAASIGEPLVLALRSPDVIDAIRCVHRDRRGGDRAVERAGADRAPVRGLRRAARRRRRRGRRDVADPARSDRGRGGSSGCAPTSSPTPATNCARRSPRCSASSRPCRAPRTTTRRRARNSSPSCANRGGAWRG